MNVAPEALVAGALACWIAWRAWRRRKAPPLPLPPEWRARLAQLVPHLRLLDAQRRERHAACVQQFLQAKRFVGCNGLAVTDDMRLAVAGLACLLLLRPGAKVFSGVRSVLLYPGTFLVPQHEPDELGLVDDLPAEQIGESWSGERVILSWPDVQAALAGDEVNVVVHEFAHQLDDEDPGTEGAPLLHDYEQWSEVMRAEYERLQRQRRPPVLDKYGAESPGEFFGVVTEAYFQRGAELQQHHPQLYALLRDYYGIETTDLRWA